MKFVKKPIEIEAFIYEIGSEPQWFTDEIKKGNVLLREEYCVIKTLEGEMRAYEGTYIIKGIKGELYPCDPEIFKESYDEVK